MRKFFLILTMIFAFLTFVGAYYVLTSGGKENAGYAVLPCLATIICLSLSKK